MIRGFAVTVLLAIVGVGCAVAAVFVVMLILGTAVH